MIELAVIVPTFNEKGNIVELISRLENALQGISWEAVFVGDDSPDGTSDRVRSLANETQCTVRSSHRLSRAIASACCGGCLQQLLPFSPLSMPICNTMKTFTANAAAVVRGDSDCIAGEYAESHWMTCYLD
jgi:hypothetical protein